MKNYWAWQLKGAHKFSQIYFCPVCHIFTDFKVSPQATNQNFLRSLPAVNQEFLFGSPANPAILVDLWLFSYLSSLTMARTLTIFHVLFSNVVHYFYCDTLTNNFIAILDPFFVVVVTYLVEHKWQIFLCWQKYHNK